MSNCARRTTGYRFERSTASVLNAKSMSMSDPLCPVGRRFLTGLIGALIAHSASPAMHEWAAKAIGAQCHYQLIEIAGAGHEELRALFDGVRRLGFARVNITFPYKEAV